MAAMALLGAGIDPEERVYCGGGYQLGNRFFRCLGRHGSMTMHTAIARSCNTYFYSMGNRIGYEEIAVMARRLGLGAEYALPVLSKSSGDRKSGGEGKRVSERVDHGGRGGRNKKRN